MAFDFFEVAKKVTQFTASAGAVVIVDAIIKENVRPTRRFAKIAVPVAGWFLAGILIDAVKNQVAKEFDEAKELIGSISEISSTVKNEA
jgi:SOS-response transcriptional repressor LexA